MLNLIFYVDHKESHGICCDFYFKMSFFLCCSFFNLSSYWKLLFQGKQASSAGSDGNAEMEEMFEDSGETVEVLQCEQFSSRYVHISLHNIV